MKCKKDPYEKCLCLKRKHGDCADCEKKAIKIVQRSGKDLNQVIKSVKDSDEIMDDLYVVVDPFQDSDECEGRPTWVFRSAIDILRGVCDYCKRNGSKVCVECMWSSRQSDKDQWFFDNSILDSLY